MRRQNRLTGFVVGVFMGVLFSAAAVLAGSLEPIVGPTEAGSQMYTLEQIYNRLNTGAAATKMTSFTEPGSGPASTGRTLVEIMGKLPVLNEGNGAGPANVAEGKTYWGLTSGQWGLRTGIMATQTLSAASDTVNAGYYAATTLRAVDANLASGNIRAGVTIFGVPGKTEVVDTTTGDAAASHILAGKKAWVDGVEVTGTIATQTLLDISNFVSPGYYEAAYLPAVDPDLASGNIGAGVRIFGVVGTNQGGCSGVAPVARTGQTSTYATGDDGTLLKGVAWPNPRFFDNANGTVTDNLTGLIWLKNANCFEKRTWAQALSDANGLVSGSCNLIDGSTAGQWRLPNIKELQSLIDFAYYNPALSNAAGAAKWSEGDAFFGVQSNSYWSSTTNPDLNWPLMAWYAHLTEGFVYHMGSKSTELYVWPVRGGKLFDVLMSWTL